MKKLLVFICLALTFIPLASAQDTYVFTETELQVFLEEHIRVAVEQSSAELIRQHLVEIALKDHTIAARDIIIADYEKQLKGWPYKRLIAAGATGVVGVSVGLLVGIIAF